MSAGGGFATKALRTALVGSVALVFVAGLVTSADAARKKKPRFLAKAAPASAVKKSNPERDGFVDVPKGGVLQIAISIGSQRLTLFRDGVRVAQSPVSTGTASHPTPTGVFSVIEKDRFHRSNLYGNAPMFFMQRVTWSGVAMHEGVLPGYAASHGCIRLPREFAARLWPTTKLGARVVIARSELAPVDFAHPRLFALRPKPTEPKVAAIEPADAIKPGLPIVFAAAATIANDAAADLTDRAPELPAAKPAAAATDDAKPADTAVVPLEIKPAATTTDDARSAASAAAPVEIAPVAAATDDVKPADTAAAPLDIKPAAAATDDAKPTDTAAAPAESKPAAAAIDEVKPADTAAAPVEIKPADIQAAPVETAASAPAGDSVDLTGAIVPLPRRNPQVLSTDLADVVVPLPRRNPLLPNDLRKAVEAPQVKAIETLQPNEPPPQRSLEVIVAAEAPPASEPPPPAPAAPVSPAQAAPASPATAPAAPASDGDERVKPAPSLSDPPKPAATRTRAADQPFKYRGQVAVFVSRKEKRIFVRQGFIPLFDMPVTIENPDQPLGTHVFTAMGFTDNGDGMRWNLITMPRGSGDQNPAKPRAADGRKKPKEAPKPVVETKPPSTAAEALNRIQMPQEAIDRISELLIPGSSLVVSDEGLGRETGRYTEFIVLTR